MSLGVHSGAGVRRSLLNLELLIYLPEPRQLARIDSLANVHIDGDIGIAV
jgi:hypothetical protein